MLVQEGTTPKHRSTHLSNYPLLDKGLGHLAALYLLLLLVARYELSHYKTIRYHLFQYLQIIPCWKPLIISFCYSLGSTLLLIERTMIDPLHLWVINMLCVNATCLVSNYHICELCIDILLQDIIYVNYGMLSCCKGIIYVNYAMRCC